MLEIQQKVFVNIPQLVMKLDLRTVWLYFPTVSVLGISICLIWEFLIVYRWIGLRSFLAWSGRKKIVMTCVLRNVFRTGIC